ncbi:MAG: c-type cytochrome [Planctomycetales bacterium]|nr:c-type cytochrome [Planctomycetales bacterium]
MNYRSPIWACVFVFIAATVYASPVVPGFQRFHKVESMSSSMGALLAGELNCLSCHQATNDITAKVSTKSAPNLTNVGSRVRPSYLRRFIANPTSTKPGTTMPDLLHGLPADGSKDQVEALVHYLVSLADEPLIQVEALIGARRRGRSLYESVGCLACHDTKSENGQSSETSVPHGDLEAKYTLSGLAGFLKNPLHARPSGRMPSLNLTTREAHDIAAYLLPNVPEKAGAAYAVYRGSWQRLPNFDELTPIKEGHSESITANVGEREHFGIRWNARFAISRAGEYQFHLGSDDGSRLSLDGKMVIDHDGVHGMIWKSKTIQLDAGTHDLQVDYFEASGEESLRLEIEGPDMKRMVLDSVLVGTSEDQPELETLRLDPDLAKQGRDLFHLVGCANCHQVNESVSIATAKPKPKPLNQLGVSAGCLAEEQQANIPDFDLSIEQRKFLASFISNVKTAGVQQMSIHSMMLAYNCYACHARDGTGGIEETRNSEFKTTQPEMGDEGRVPPPLDGVGAKITSEWLDGILAEGANDRPYMLTRMPKFGASNVGHIRYEFEKHDSLPSLPEIEFDQIAGKKAAWKMIGTQGFGCIQCHTFGRYKSTGVQSMDMTVMTKRLKQNWFRTYVRDPQTFRKGTRMPQAWQNDQSVFKDLLDGTSATQIAAVWEYLNDGPRAKTPFGLVTNSMELIPADETLIYRNFIEGAGSRAIGVGYPAGINLAFDANNMTVALIWQGAFIDAKRHWTGRGQGYEPPLGEKLQTLGKAVSFATLSSANDPWPEQGGRELGYRFRGYRLGEDRNPTFFYSVHNASISDSPSVRETATSVFLVRQIAVSVLAPNDQQLYYRAATSDSIDKLDDNWYQVGEELKISIRSSSSVKPILRESNGRNELLVPIRSENEIITQEYSW